MRQAVAILARGTVESVDSVLAAAELQSQRHDVFLQLVDPAAVYSERHVASAFLHAERAQAQGRAAARDLGAAFLKYLTGERQASDAVAKSGIRAGLDRIVVVAAGARAGTAIWGLLDKLAWSRDPKGLAPNPDALARLGLTRAGDENLEDAVLEKVALVDLLK